MCTGFDSQTRRHMWVEFVVGSRPCPEGFSPGSPVFLPPQKSTFLNSNSIGNSRAMGSSVEDCYVLPSLNIVNLLFISPSLLPCQCCDHVTASPKPVSTLIWGGGGGLGVAIDEKGVSFTKGSTHLGLETSSMQTMSQYFYP